jgi:hypothetical protein
MQLYKIEGRTAKFGIGQEFTLDAEQIASRSHAISIGKKSGDRFAVTAAAPLEFKAGEVIGLPEAPKHLLDALVEVSAGEDSEAAKQKRSPAGRNGGKKGAVKPTPQAGSQGFE